MMILFSPEKKPLKNMLFFVVVNVCCLYPQALSATDLNLVLYVCETIDSQQVFGQHPCPLSQPVLLSLIQQLSSNLSTRSDLKIR